MKLKQSITDYTSKSEVAYSNCCKKLDTIFKWRNSDEESVECCKEVNIWADILKKLYPDTRKVFCIMIDRSNQGKFGLKVVMHEIEEVTGLHLEELIKHFEMLQMYGFLSYIQYDDYENPICFIKNLLSGWNFWSDLKQFTSITTMSLEEIIVNLKFKLLD